MKTTQGRVSQSIDAFKEAYLEKYGLVEVVDSTAPVVMFGLYNDVDYKYYLTYPGPIIVVWCGSDSMRISDPVARLIKSREAKHIAKSKFISEDLEKFKIKHEILPITWQTAVLFPTPRGEYIYQYSSIGMISEFYGDHYIPEIKERTGFDIIRCAHGLYDRTVLNDIYAKYFIGLRLTFHDGVPNTVVELGMMGRRCLYNGNLPNAIPWKNIDDICENIIYEYKNRQQDDTRQISEAMKKFINIGDNWLNI